jgi:hypothetical protein
VPDGFFQSPLQSPTEPKVYFGGMAFQSPFQSPTERRASPGIQPNG